MSITKIDLKKLIDKLSKRVITIDFYYEDAGIIAVLVKKNGKPEKEIIDEIKKELDKYREEDEDYDTDGLFAILEDMNDIDVILTISYTGKHVVTSTDYDIYF